MTSGGNKFSVFPKNLLTKVVQFKQLRQIETKVLHFLFSCGFGWPQTIQWTPLSLLKLSQYFWCTSVCRP